MAASYDAMRSEVDLPFKRTRRVFNRLGNWCLAISIGTLLWFIGNFNKFIVKAADGVSDYIPYKNWYLALLFLFFLSTLCFIGMRGYEYLLEFYDMRLRDITDIFDRAASGKTPLSTPEDKYVEDIYEEYNKGYLEEHSNKNLWGKTKWLSDLRISNISRTIDDFGGGSIHIWNARMNRFLLLGSFFYIVGLVISVCYVLSFLWYYYDP